MFLNVLVLCCLTTVSYGSTSQYQGAPDSFMTKLKLGMHHDTFSGAYDLDVKICTYPQQVETCCHVKIGDTITAYGYEQEVSDECKEVPINVNNKLKVEVTSQYKNQFNVEYVFLWLQNGAMYRVQWRGFHAHSNNLTDAILRRAPSKDCILGFTDDWTECTKSCATGTQTRTQKVIYQGYGDGKKCPQPKNETQDCNTQTCPGVHLQLGYSSSELDRSTRDIVTQHQGVAIDICTSPETCCQVDVDLSGNATKVEDPNMITRIIVPKIVCDNLTIDPSQPPTARLSSFRDIDMTKVKIEYVVIEDEDKRKFLGKFAGGSAQMTIIDPRDAEDYDVCKFNAWSPCTALCGPTGRKNRTRNIRVSGVHDSSTTTGPPGGLGSCVEPKMETQTCNPQSCSGFQLTSVFADRYYAGAWNVSIQVCNADGKCCLVNIGDVEPGHEETENNVCPDLSAHRLSPPPTVEVKLNSASNAEKEGFFLSKVTIRHNDDQNVRYEATWTEWQYQGTIAPKQMRKVQN